MQFDKSLMRPFKSSFTQFQPICWLSLPGGLMLRALKSLAVVPLLAAAALAQDLAAFEKQVTVKTLSNGLTAIVCRRPDTAPVSSFYTNVDAGSAPDPMAKTGLRHMFHDQAFKG